MPPWDAEPCAVLIASTLGIDGFGSRPGNGGGTAGCQPSQSGGQEQLSETHTSEPVSAHAILGVGESLFGLQFAGREREQLVSSRGQR